MCNKAIGYCDGSCDEAIEYWEEQDRLTKLAQEIREQKENK